MKLHSIFQAGFLFLAGFFCSQVCMGTTYYLSATGNDANAGTTPATAWLTNANVNTAVFLPGDSLLLEGGSTFAGPFYFDGFDADGGAANPFVVSSYGTGKAIIDGGTGFGIFINNTAGIEVSDLIVAGSGMGTNLEYGVRMYNNLAGNVKKAYLWLTNLEVYGFRKGGISIKGENVNSGFQDVEITHCVVHDCLDRGIDMEGDFDKNKTGYAHANVNVRHCEVYNITGYNKTEHSGNGIVLADVQGSVIEYCLIHDCGSGNTSCGGPVGAWYWDADQVTIQFCEVYNMSSGTGCDGGGFDLDGGVTNGVMQYNYSHDNAGGGFLIGEFWDARPMANITCRYNISENDALTNGGSLYLFNIAPIPINNVDIYHNTFYLSPSALNMNQAVFLIANYYPGFNNIRAANNIFFANGGVPLISIPAGAGFDASFYGNCYHAPGGFSIDYKGTNYASLAAFRTGSGKEVWNVANTGMQVDPGLIAPGGGTIIGFGNPFNTLLGYYLALAAPVLDMGLDLNTEFGINIGTQDFFGNPAVSGAAQDIGAYESQTLLHTDHLQESLEQSASWITLLSNPFDQTISLLPSDAQEGPVALMLLDMQGKTVAHTVIQTAPGSQIDWQLSAPVPAGTYLLMLRWPDRQKMIRVQKQ